MSPRTLRWLEALYGLWLRVLWVAPRDELRDVCEVFRDLIEDTARNQGRRDAWLTVGRCFATALGASRGWQPQRSVAPAPALGTATVAPDPKAQAKPLEALHDDLRTGLRGLRRRPGFAFAVILLLALGIGATTTVWSVVDGVLLRDLPYPDVDRLVAVTEGAHSGQFLEALRDGTQSFDAVVAAWGDDRVDLTGAGAPRDLVATNVSEGFLQLFGARAEVGRLLQANDFTVGERTVLLTAGLWRQHWGGQRDIVGTSILLDGEPHRVVGVVAADFVPPEAMVGSRVDLWRPVAPDHPWLDEWNIHVFDIVARLRPGVSQAQADDEVRRFNEGLAQQYEERTLRDGSPRHSPLESLQQVTVGDIRSHLLLLLGAVGLLLLVGLVNVANLSLARGADRQREMALRMALGAARHRLARPLFVESLLLALAGGGLGLGLAAFGLRLLDHFRPAGFPRFGEVAIDPRVAVFGLALSVATGLLFGLLPVLQASRSEVRSALGDGRRGGSDSPQRQRFRGMLVVAEVAMAVILLFGAGLLFNSLLQRLDNDPGFEPEGLVRLELQLGERAYDADSRAAFVERLIERLEAVPGVQRAAASWILPFDYFGSARCCWTTQLSLDPEDEPLRVRMHPVTPGYFETLGAKLLRGRGLEAQDATLETTPVVLNETLAQRFFGSRDEDPLGQTLDLSGRRTLEVVGVVRSIRHYGYDAPPEPMAYVPYGRDGGPLPELAVALRSDLGLTPELAGSLREAVWELDADLPIASLGTLPAQMGRSLTEPRFYTLLLSTFALLSLVLAAAGLYGTLVYAVGQRRKELGIRLALGARGRDLSRLVVGQGLALTGLGLLLGSLGALSLGHLLERLVYGIGFQDPTTLAATAGLLLTVATIASWLPGRRAARTNPLETLRSE